MPKTQELLTIGELAEQTGLATSALRYYEEVGLLPAPKRISGQRRYEPNTVTVVGVIILLRDVGFSLTEIRDLFAAPGSRAEWREAGRRKLAELDEQIHKIQVAHVALDHTLRCRQPELIECPSFLGVIAARLEGTALEDALEH